MRFGLANRWRVSARPRRRTCRLCKAIMAVSLSSSEPTTNSNRAPQIRFTVLAAWLLTSAALAAQTVEGHVINAATGAGIPGVRVRIFATPGAPADGQSATTDAQGRFRIEGLEAGAYSARYTAAGFS